MFTDKQLATIAEVLELALSDENFIDTTSGGGCTQTEAEELREEMRDAQAAVFRVSRRQTDLTHYADLILEQIHQDMKTPFPHGKQIPPDVGSFSALHDYCDANTYLLDFIPRDDFPSWDHYMEICNNVSDLVDKALKDEADHIRETQGLAGILATTLAHRDDVIVVSPIENDRFEVTFRNADHAEVIVTERPFRPTGSATL